MLASSRKEPPAPRADAKHRPLHGFAMPPGSAPPLFFEGGRFFAAYSIWMPALSSSATTSGKLNRAPFSLLAAGSMA